MKLGELDVPATKACIILLQELGQHVNLLLHTRALRMIALTAVCALGHFSFVLILMGVLIWTLGLLLRLVLVSLLLMCLFSFFISLLIHPWISGNQIFVFGRFDGSHHELILLLCEGFHELCKIRNIPGSCCQLGGMKCRKKHGVVRTNLL